MSSRTSRTVTASACFEAAARAARQARSRESVTRLRPSSATRTSSALEVLSCHDHDVADPRRLGTNVHLSHAKKGPNLLRSGEEALRGCDDLRLLHIERL